MVYTQFEMAFDFISVSVFKSIFSVNFFNLSSKGTQHINHTANYTEKYMHSHWLMFQEENSSVK